MKTRMKLRRFKCGSEECLEGKCFIQFLALTVRCMIEHLFDKRKKQGDPPHRSLSHTLRELMGIREIYYSATGQHVIVTMSKKQRETLQFFNLKLPKTYFDDIAEANKVKTAPKPHGDDLKK